MSSERFYELEQNVAGLESQLLTLEDMLNEALRPRDDAGISPKSVSRWHLTDNVASYIAGAHTIAEHSDTTATGAQLNTLVGGGVTALHDHDHDVLTNYVANEHIDWTNAGSNFLTSGTATISGDVAVDTDTLFVDVSEDKVGINTSSIASPKTLYIMDESSAATRSIVVTGEYQSSNTDITTTPSAGLNCVNSDTTVNNYASVIFSSDDSTAQRYGFGHIACVFTDHTAGSIDGDFAFVLRKNNAWTETIRMTGTGDLDVKLHNASSVGLKLGGTLFTGSAANLNTLVGGGVTALHDHDHDVLTNYVANEHIDWTNAGSNFLTSGTATCSTLKYTSTVGAEQTSLQSFWAFRYADGLGINNTGVYFNMSTAKFEFYYANSVVFDISTVGTVTTAKNLTVGNNLQVDGTTTLGDGTSDLLSLTFNGLTNDSAISWDGSNDYFKVNDDWFVQSQNKIYFNVTSNYIWSDTDQHLDLESSLQIDLNADTVVGGSLTVQDEALSKTSTGGFVTLETSEATIVATDVLGTITFVGDDNQGRRTGAMIKATATAGWGANVNDAPTKIEFFTQDNTNTDVIANARFTIQEDGDIAFGSGEAGKDINLIFTGETTSGLFAWMEDEDYFEFSDDILLNTSERLNFRDTSQYIYSSSATNLSIVSANTYFWSYNLSFGTNSNNDVVMTFNSTTNDGVLTWMEDEDYFKFSDDIMMADGENIVLDITTGTKIGTATTQKLGFYNATPVVQPSAYTPSNVVTDRSYDANATTTAELADVLGTLIADLQSLGLIG